jgi:hypothetical protein
MISILPLMLIPVLAQLGGRTELPVPEEEVATAVFIDTVVGTPAKKITASQNEAYLYRIENRWINNGFLNTEYAWLDTQAYSRETSSYVPYGPAPEDWWSSYWEVVPAGSYWNDKTPKVPRYYIRNRWKGWYLVSRLVYRNGELVDERPGLDPAYDPWSAGSEEGYTFQLIPRVVGGVPCFTIRNEYSGDVHVENQMGIAEAIGSLEKGTWTLRWLEEPWAPADWWSSCWILREYPKW